MEYRATDDWPYSVCSGGAVWRLRDGVREYAVLYRDRNGARTWHLPKGTLDSAETLEQCALREIREESGLVVTVGRYLGGLQGEWSHPDSGRHHDTVRHYFLCAWQSGTLAPTDGEHDGGEWLSGAEAQEKLGAMPKRENEIIKRAERV